MSLVAVLHCATAVCSIAGVLVGLWAAWLWWSASKIEIRPYIQPTGYEAEAWVNEARPILQKVGALNARAAFWTAASVLCGAVSGAIGFLNSN